MEKKKEDPWLTDETNSHRKESRGVRCGATPPLGVLVRIWLSALHRQQGGDSGLAC